MDFPYRTVVIKKGVSWELVEIASRGQDEDEIEECEEETAVVCFFHQSSDVSMDIGAIVPREVTIALKPKLSKRLMGKEDEEEETNVAGDG